MLPEEDVVRLRHMLDAAEQAVAFAKGRTRQDLDGNKMLVFALVRAIEIIGEAANQVSAAGRAQAPSLPWQEMVGMRNRLIHAYFDINLDRLWDTTAQDLPALIAVLQNVLGSAG